MTDAQMVGLSIRKYERIFHKMLNATGNCERYYISSQDAEDADDE
jgi:hypothetical protein